MKGTTRGVVKGGTGNLRYSAFGEDTQLSMSRHTNVQHRLWKQLKIAEGMSVWRRFGELVFTA